MICRSLLSLFVALSLGLVFIAAGFPNQGDGFVEASEVVVADGDAGYEEVDEVDLAPLACEGTNLGKGWCPKKTCATLDCAGNWYSINSDYCTDHSTDPSTACGWAVCTSHGCACVTDGNAEPPGYSCGPCGKKQCKPWPSACQ